MDAQRLPVIPAKLKKVFWFFFSKKNCFLERRINSCHSNTA